MINSCGTGKRTDFFLFLFSSLSPITPFFDCYRSQAIIKERLYNPARSSRIVLSGFSLFAAFGGRSKSKSRII